MNETVKPCDLPCEKCGHADVYRIFRPTASSWHVEEYGKARNKFASATSHRAEAWADHIDHKCRCCGYNWQTRPLSKRRKTKPEATP